MIQLLTGCCMFRRVSGTDLHQVLVGGRYEEHADTVRVGCRAAVSSIILLYISSSREAVTPPAGRLLLCSHSGSLSL